MADPGPVDFGANKFYFGGENAIENVDTFIEGYEVENLCRFIKVKSKRFVKPDRSKLNRRVFWESGYGLPPIQFDGVPFMVLGHQVRECFNGPDRHRARKKKKGPKKQGEHDYCAKSRRAIQTTKKMLCPAAIHLRSVVRFPALQIERNCDSARRRVGKQLSADLGDDEKEVAWEHRVYVSLPGVDAHQNHLVDDVSIAEVVYVAQECFTYLCDFHREQAWERWLKTSANGVGEHKKELLQRMRAIGHADSEESYQDAVTFLRESPCWQENERLRVWFEKQWLSASRRWVQYHRLAMFNIRENTTNGLERQHSELKHSYLSQYTEGTLTSLAKTLVNHFFPDSIRR